MKLLTYLPFLGFATAAALPAGGPTKDPPRATQEKFEHAKEQCNRLVGKRREVCLCSLHGDRAPPVVLVTKGHAKRNDVDGRDEELGQDGCCRVDDGETKKWMVVNVGPDGSKVVDVKKPAESAREKEKRGIEVKADDNGVVDLAIPVKVSPTSNNGDWNQNQAIQSDYQYAPEQQPSNANDFAVPASFFPAPTTLQTVPTATPTPTQGHLPPIEIDNAITFAPTTTYPVHRTLQTTTLANGTELRIEQTESDVHDVHIEETEHQKGAPEEDKVVVHVKVFVEHLRQQAGRAVDVVKRGLGLEGSVVQARAVEAAEKAAYCNKLCKIFMMCSCSKEEYKEGAEFWIGDLDDSARKVKKRDVEAAKDVQAVEKLAAPQQAAYCSTLCKIFFMCDCTHEEQIEGVRWWLPSIDDNSAKMVKKRDVDTKAEVKAAEKVAAPQKAAYCNKLCKIFMMCSCSREEYIDGAKFWLGDFEQKRDVQARGEAAQSIKHAQAVDQITAAPSVNAVAATQDAEEEGSDPWDNYKTLCKWTPWCDCAKEKNQKKFDNRHTDEHFPGDDD